MLMAEQLLCDSFAKAGLLTYGVDYLNKDPVPADAMEKGNFDVGHLSFAHLMELMGNNLLAGSLATQARCAR